MTQSIWITGGKGFIGRHLARSISSEAYVVHGLGHGFWIPDDFVRWGFSSWLNAEIDFSSLSNLASNEGFPEAIFHLAGGSAVGPSLQHPYEDFQRTVDTTARLLDWVRQQSPKTRVIGVSSAAIYGAGFSGAISEQTTGIPFSPYGFHKAMLESLFTAYRETYALNLGIVRLFSVYGPGLEKQLLWDICQKLEKADNGEILLHGTGHELRDWLHVQDACDLLRRMAQIPDLPDVVNGGTGHATSISEIAKLVSNAWGGQAKVRFSGVGRKGDPNSLIADISRARSLGFCPTIAIRAGVDDVVRWYKTRLR